MHDHKQEKFVTRKKKTEMMCAADIEGITVCEPVQTLSF